MESVASPGILVIVIGAVGVLALLIGIAALVQARSVTRRFGWVAKGESNVDTLTSLLRAVEGSQRDITALQSAFQAAQVEARTHFKHMGIVRYNAFDGVAGQQSYSLTLLDENENGILISNLVGTNFSRSYAVEIKTGEPTRPLGDEETQSLALAKKNGN